MHPRLFKVKSVRRGGWEKAGRRTEKNKVKASAAPPAAELSVLGQLKETIRGGDRIIRMEEMRRGRFLSATNSHAASLPHIYIGFKLYAL